MPTPRTDTKPNRIRSHPMARTASDEPVMMGFDIAVLWSTFHAVGYTPPVAPLVLGYIIGYLANLVPVPGSVGILDGGLVGALIIYGAPAAQATAAVLVYHAIAFWIPSLGGLFAYGLLRRQPLDHQIEPLAVAASAT